MYVLRCLWYLMELQKKNACEALWWQLSFCLNPSLAHHVLKLLSIVFLCCLYSEVVPQEKSLKVTGKSSKFCVCFCSEP